MRFSHYLLIFLSTISLGLAITILLTHAAPSTFEYYGVKFAGTADADRLTPLGANLYLLVFRPEEPENNWRAALDAAAAKNLRVVVWIWGGGGNVGHSWLCGGASWDLSKGERFLAFAKNYVAQYGNRTLHAIYGPHETIMPLNG